MPRRLREDIYKRFYTDKFGAHKAVVVHYIEDAFNDFFNQYPFDRKNIVDYDHKKMLSHIVFDLLRLIGDAGFRVYELLTDYVDDLYNRDELRITARANLDNLKLTNVN